MNSEDSLNDPNQHSALHPMGQTTISQETCTCSNVLQPLPSKIEAHRIRTITGGDRTPYSRDNTNPSAGITNTKLQIIATISTPGARCCGVGMSNFYLNEKLPEHEHVCIDLHLTLYEFI